MTTWTDHQLREAISAYGPTSMRGELAAAVLELRAALVVAEDALAVKASLRDGEQAKVQRALDRVRDALRKTRGES